MNKFFSKLFLSKKTRKKIKAEKDFARKCEQFPIFKNNIIQENAVLTPLENIEMGGKVYIGENCRIFAEGGLKIGAYTKIGEDCLIMTTNHNYKSSTRVPYDHFDMANPIEIGKNVWIGARSLILAGVKIDDGAIVAAGSVLTKSVPYCAIVGGNPAKIIGYRDIEEYERLEKAGMNYPQPEEKALEVVIFEDFKPYLKEKKNEKAQ